MHKHGIAARLFIAGTLATSLSATAQPPVPSAYAGGMPVSSVRVWELRVPQAVSSSITVATPVTDARMTTQYVDGLGRPVQAVVKQGSLVTGGSAKDLVSPVIYDEFGREQYKYVPFAAGTTGGNTSVNDGRFKQNPFAQQAAFMTAQYGSQGETYFYGKTVFEPSPLNRVAESFAPGNSWMGTAAEL
ncbi:MAG: DUF6443 domain-containing protein, partial [Chitinophagaceae bacterium]